MIAALEPGPGEIDDEMLSPTGYVVDTIAVAAAFDSEYVVPPERLGDIAFIQDTLELFAADEIPTVVGELQRILRPDGRLCVVTMERAGAEDDLFVHAYDWLFERVPGYERFGCRPIYASRTLEEAGFVVERQEHLHRAWVWPVEILIARPM